MCKETLKRSLNIFPRAHSGCFLWRCSRYGQAIKGFVWVLWSPNRKCSPSGRPRAARPRSNGHSGLAQRCRVSTLWLGLHLTVLNGCLETSLGQTQTPRSPAPPGATSEPVKSARLHGDRCWSKSDQEASSETGTRQLSPFHSEVSRT